MTHFMLHLPDGEEQMHDTSSSAHPETIACGSASSLWTCVRRRLRTFSPSSSLPPSHPRAALAP